MLTGRQFELLNNCIANRFGTYTTPTELARMLKFRLDKNLSDIALAVGLNMRDIAFEVISCAEQEGWTGALIAAAQDYSPHNKEIAALAEELAVGATGVARSALESIVKASGSVFVDVEAFYQAYGIRRGQVCQIDYPTANGPTYGTGFLVGPDLLLTARHVVGKAIAAKLPGSAITCRFDYKRLPNGTKLPGTIYHPVGDGWLVADRPHAKSDETGSGEPKADELDYALIRLDGAPGRDVLGRGNTAGGGGGVEKDATRRGWIRLRPEAPAAITGSSVLVLEHPDAQPMQLAIGKVLAAANVLRLRHDARSLGGSSGSPCFDSTLEVMALHHAGDPLHSKLCGDFNQGIPMEKIVADLKARGVEPFWEQEPPPPAEPSGG